MTEKNEIEIFGYKEVSRMMNEQQKVTLITNLRALSEPCQGWLEKQKPGSSAYQLRLFILEGNVLMYYESETSGQFHPRGVIPLVGSTITSVPERDGRVFEISLAGETNSRLRTFNLRAKDTNERDSWMAKLQVASLLSRQNLLFLIDRALVKPLNMVTVTTAAPPPPPPPVPEPLPSPQPISEERASSPRPTSTSSSSSSSEESANGARPIAARFQQPLVLENATVTAVNHEECRREIEDLKLEVKLWQHQLQVTCDKFLEAANHHNATTSRDRGRGPTTQPQMPIAPDAVQMFGHTMFDPVRSLVRQDKVPHDTLGLDLAYITNQIIAMGFPAEGIKATFRNPYSRILEFLDANHAGKYRVYNLCSENRYDPGNFHGCWKHVPFDDHTPPNLRLARRCCEDALHFLSEAVDHVVIVHCMAGKGRTGTIICMLLLQLRVCQSAEEAMRYFNERRMKFGKVALNNPGQVRYVRYYERALNAGFPVAKAVLLHQITIHELPASDTNVYIVITCNESDLNFKKTFDSRHGGSTTISDGKIDFSVELEFEGGDVRVEVFKQNALSLLDDDRMFRFFFNTGLESSPFTIQKSDIDEAHKDRKHRWFSKDLKVSAVFSSAP